MMKKILNNKFPVFIAGLGVVAFTSLFVFGGYDETKMTNNLYNNPSITSVQMEKSADILFHKESLYSSVVVEQVNDNKVMKIGGRTQCSDTVDAREGLERLATKPVELFNDNPEKILVIGLGCGYTSQKLNEFDVTTIELDQAVLDASKYFTDQKAIINDGRNWLQRSDEKFDIIITQPDHPYSGSWQLFTLEYFQLVSDHLTENGISAQWIPASNMKLEDFYITYNTMHEVFPYVYIYNLKEIGGHLIFISSNVPLNAVEERLYWGSNENIIDHQTELSTDDKPIIEFSTARNVYDPNPDEIFKELNKLRGS